jgi:biopolymer transport protein ExbB
MLLWQHWVQGDGLTRLVVLLLLGMSIASWVVILAKLWLLRQATPAVAQSVAVFWQSDRLDTAEQTLQATDTRAWVWPLVQAARRASDTPTAGLRLRAGLEQRLTRGLRDTLSATQARLQWGQVLLATVGATAPFVGLLGTVWGIYHALQGMAAEGQATLDKVSGPVGEALVMTAAGLAVAIPAVLAYNVLGRWAAGTEALLDAFAHDLRALALNPEGPPDAEA